MEPGRSGLLGGSRRSAQYGRTVDAVVLAAAAGDLQRTDAVAQFGTAIQAPASFQAVQQGRTEGITAARRVDHLGGTDAGHGAAFTLNPQFAALGTQGHHDTLQV